MKIFLRLPCLLLLSCLVPAVLAACPPEGWSRGALEALKKEHFRLEDTARRQALVLGLLDCLADPDPTLRDGIAYEAYATWLRGDALTPETRRTLLSQLLVRLTPDAEGYGPPFAALVLSEVARTDRILAWMTPVQREDLVEIGSASLASVRDYRGFDAAQGWRHGVAHGADLLMQLALNPEITRGQLDRMLAAVATQVAPPGEHFYTYGEPERLARPVLFALQRGLHDDAAWSAWLQGVVAPAPLSEWSAAFASPAGLAKRHNTRAFLLALYVGLAESGDEAMKARLPAVVAALRTVP